MSCGSKDSPSPSIDPAPLGNEITLGFTPDLSAGAAKQGKDIAATIARTKYGRTRRVLFVCHLKFIPSLSSFELRKCFMDIDFFLRTASRLTLHVAHAPTVGEPRCWRATDRSPRALCYRAESAAKRGSAERHHDLLGHHQRAIGQARGHGHEAGEVRVAAVLRIVAGVWRASGRWHAVRMVAAAHEQNEGDATYTVVYVEDDERLARLTVQYLVSHGLDVFLVTRGDQALSEVLRADLAPHILDELRVNDCYRALAERARRKRELIAKSRADASTAPSIPALRLWYFERKLGRTMPDDVETS